MYENVLNSDLGHQSANCKFPLTVELGWAVERFPVNIVLFTKRRFLKLLIFSSETIPMRCGQEVDEVTLSSALYLHQPSND